ncbi:hypothetical protein [Bradyrhizobium sp. Leo121]|uniref:hypothetical protein n=1 Tax=Bradyrhizobium sp. Leo121 TaxID=1571195 RepID=UPI0010289BD1|nr:hypothetical protein [Bradyrhizobium sp. Leo121]
MKTPKSEADTALRPFRRNSTATLALKRVWLLWRKARIIFRERHADCWDEEHKPPRPKWSQPPRSERTPNEACPIDPDKCNLNPDPAPARNSSSGQHQSHYCRKLPSAGQRDCSTAHSDDPARGRVELSRERTFLQPDHPTRAFCILLSADQFRPSKSMEKPLRVSQAASRLKSGKFVLWRSNVKFANRAERLQMMSVAKSSICDPAAAPYDGATAVQVTKVLGVSAAIQPNKAGGASITHAYQPETGNAELGFVAPPELTNSKIRCRWLVAQESYGQDAVLLETGTYNKLSAAFVNFLKWQKLHAIIARGGYVQS